MSLKTELSNVPFSCQNQSHPALSHVHPLKWSQEQLCFLKNKGKDSPLCQMNTTDRHSFRSIPNVTFVFQFSSLWICYHSAYLIMFSPLPQPFILKILNLVANTEHLQCTSTAIGGSHAFIHSHVDPRKQALLLSPFLQRRRLRSREFK